MNKIRYAVLALVVTLVTLSISASAQTKSGIGACFDGIGNAGLGGDVRTDFAFENIPFLLELESYDSGKTLTVYGKAQGKSAEKNVLGVFDYGFVPFLTSCSKKDGLIAALKQAYPGYKIKFAGEKGKKQQAKEGVKTVKDGVVGGVTGAWGKLKKQKP